MPSRTRTLTASVPVSGTYFHYLNRPQEQLKIRVGGLTSKCDDVVGNRTEDNPLKIQKSFREVVSLDGENRASGSGNLLVKFTHSPMDHFPPIPDPYVQYPAVNTVAANNWAWKILAETNPSAPHVSVPTFIVELREIPSLIQDWGSGLLPKLRKAFSKNRAGERFARSVRRAKHQIDSVAQAIASGNLTWRWAIRPLIGDLQKLLGFVNATEGRFRELANLQKDRSIRKRVSLAADTFEKPPVIVTCHSDGASVRLMQRTSYWRKAWGTSHWHATDYSVLPKRVQPIELTWLADRITLGLTSYEAFAAAWELMPWSWLVDWFTGFGDIIKACNNTLGLRWGRLCFMQTIAAQNRYSFEGASTKSSWITLSGMPREWMVRKERFPVFPAAPFSLSYLPLIDQRKWSILASLAVLRGTKPGLIRLGR